MKSKKLGQKMSFKINSSSSLPGEKGGEMLLLQELTPPLFHPEKTDKPDSIIREINTLKETTKIKRLRYKLRKKNRLRVIGFSMELRNGDNVTIMSFLEEDATFNYLGGIYIWDNDLQYLNKSSGLMFNDYHQDFSLPITTRININEVRDSMAQGEQSDIEYATNPVVLKRFLQSSIQDLMLRGGVIWDLLKQIRLITVIVLVLAFIALFLSGYAYYKLGVFSGKAQTQGMNIAASSIIFWLMKKKRS